MNMLKGHNLYSGRGDYENGGGDQKTPPPFFGGITKTRVPIMEGITKSYFRISQNLTLNKYDLQNSCGYAAFNTVSQYSVTRIGGKSQTIVCSMCSLTIIF